MKHKIFNFGFILFSIFIGLDTVKAASTASTGVNELYIRKLPTTDSLIEFKIPYNTTITLIRDTNEKGNGCADNWFEVEYNNYSGYVCSTYLASIHWETTNEENQSDVNDKKPDDTKDEEQSTEDKVDIEKKYQEELAKFPNSYKKKIEELHKIYPNAIFKIQNVNVNFNDFASYEYQGYGAYALNGCPLSLPKGVSLIEDTNRSRDGLKSLDSWAYNVLTDTFNTNWDGGQVNRWYIPSLNTIKYYLDPRNFLNDRSIFMFEDLSYVEGQYTQASIEKALAGSFMANAKVTGRENTTFSQAFIDAGKKHNVTPFALIARVLQEIGYTRTTMASGAWDGENGTYKGYYNFYNIQAAGSSVYETIKNGLAYAKSQGWNNEYSAIVGGASFLAGDYVASGQNTTYLQKFDVYGPCYARHQYMQNVEAPLSESYKIYNTYSAVGMLQNNFTFIIPVYNNMPDTTKLDDSRNSNNYLRDLTINGVTVEGFSYQKYEYTINVSPLISSVEIAATKASSKSSINGTGKFDLTSTSQTKNIVVTAENGTTKTYKITVTRNADIPIKISEILNTMLIDSDGTYISAIKLDTKVNDFISLANTVDKNALIEIKNSDGKIKEEEEILATNDTVTITSGEEKQTFIVVIYGDLTGDGIINSADLLKMRQHLIGTIKLDGAYKIAANVNKDEQINSADLLKIRQHLIGSATIVQ